MTLALAGLTDGKQRVTITANSASDVGIAAYRQGKLMGQSDNTLNGTETFNFVTIPDAKYVLVVTGFETQTGEYPVSLSLTSP